MSLTILALLASSAFAPSASATQLASTFEDAPAQSKPAQDARAPRVELSARDWDFGLAWYGDPCETTIDIRNTGTAPLRILDVKSSCGCTIARPGNDTLAPGAKEPLRITYDTKKGFKQVRQTLTLQTDDPKEPTILIRVTGEVRHLFDMQPGERIAFDQLTQNAEVARTVYLRCNVPDPVTLKLAPQPPRSRFSAELAEIEPGKTYKLDVKTLPPLDKGYNSTNIILETNHTKYPTFEVPVTAYAMERVAVVPEKVLVLQQNPAPRVQTVRVSFLPDHPINVLSATSDSPQVTVDVAPRRERPDRSGMFEYQLVRISLPAYNDMSENGAKVTIKTDDPEFGTIVVPIEKLKPPIPGNTPAQTTRE